VDDASKIGTGANSDTATSKDWEFNLAPFYLWAVSMEGEQTVGSNTALPKFYKKIADTQHIVVRPFFLFFKICQYISKHTDES
jgi:hypothetical protein